MAGGGKGYGIALDKVQGRAMGRKRARMEAAGKSEAQIQRGLDRQVQRRTPQWQQTAHNQFQDVLRRWGGPSGDLTQFGYGPGTFSQDPFAPAPDVARMVGMGGGFQGQPTPAIGPPGQSDPIQNLLKMLMGGG